MDKLKVLIFGCVKDPELFASKLKSLQASKAGPFDVAFCVGKSALISSSDASDHHVQFPIPVYVQDDVKAALSPAEDQSDDSAKNEPILIAPNLYLLPASCGLWSLTIHEKKPPLVVASCPWNIRIDSSTVKENLLQQLRHVSYRGCDLLLSHEWPQGVENHCEVPVGYSKNQIVTSYDVAHVALEARARYHVSAGTFFCQSSPFDHIAATTNTVQCYHIGRFLSMAPVQQPASDANKKAIKFVRALGFVPLQGSSPAELQAQRPAQVQPNPFTDKSYQQDPQAPGSNSMRTSTTGLSAASSRRILQEERQQGATNHRWASSRRNHNPRGAEEDDGPVDPTNTVLFVHGLHQDVAGRLQMPETGDPILFQYTRNKGTCGRW